MTIEYYDLPTSVTGADACSPCLSPNGPFNLAGGGDLTPTQSLKSYKDCLVARQKCPSCDPDAPGSVVCASLKGGTNPPGPSGEHAAAARAAVACASAASNPNPSQGLTQCCEKECHGQPSGCQSDCVQIAYHHESGGGGGSPQSSCVGASDPITCCGEQANGCPQGCSMNQGGECVPSASGGGGDESSKCGQQYPEVGCYAWDSDDMTCDYMGQRTNTPNCQYQSCSTCFREKGQGGGPAPAPSPPSGSCKATDPNACSGSQYCSVSDGSCTSVPNKWTKDFYNSAIVTGEAALQAEKVKNAKEVATCMVNGWSSKCGVTDPTQLKKNQNCVMQEVTEACMKSADPTKLYKPPVLQDSNDGHSSGNGSRVGHTIGMVFMIIGILLLVGLLIYVFYTKVHTQHVDGILPTPRK